MLFARLCCHALFELGHRCHWLMGSSYQWCGEQWLTFLHRVLQVCCWRQSALWLRCAKKVRTCWHTLGKYVYLVCMSTSGCRSSVVLLWRDELLCNRSRLCEYLLFLFLTVWALGSTVPLIHLLGLLHVFEVICSGFDFVLSVLGKRLGGKSISNMTYFVSSGM